ncbi:MAG: mechanosensitive ion channel [Opitutae bacterium]|mgnify:FL=1|nr:mechanosensitive ion channel [Opitutae bacterium]MBT5377675.1 mechanosensitive ion channel [Opitutae bacterium]
MREKKKLAITDMANTEDSIQSNVVHENNLSIAENHSQAGGVTEGGIAQPPDAMLEFWKEIFRGDFHRIDSSEVLHQFIGMGVAIAIGILAGFLFKRALLYWIGRDGVVTSGEERLQKAAQLEVPVFLVAFSLGALAFFQKQGWEVYLLKPFALFVSAYSVFKGFSGAARNRFWMRLGAWIIFVLLGLHIFGILGPVAEVLESMGFALGETRISLLSLLKGIGVLVVLLWVSSLLNRLSKNRIAKLPEVNPSMQVLLEKVVQISLLMIAVMASLSTAGLNLSSLTLFGGAIGLGIGFGLQKVISNLVCGVILLLDRSIKPGDVIEIEGTYGWINSLRARYVSVITRDGKEHLIPNEDLVTQKVTNWSFTDTNVRMRIPVGVSYDTDVRKAMELCVEAGASESRVLNNPEPVCRVTGFGDNSVDLELRVWITDPVNGSGNVRSAVLLEIWDRFQENDIEIPFPQRDLHIRNPEALQKQDA